MQTMQTAQVPRYARCIRQSFTGRETAQKTGERRKRELFRAILRQEKRKWGPYAAILASHEVFQPRNWFSRAL
jgi:hypothetical protein